MRRPFVALLLALLSVSASAMQLKSCETITTVNGIRWVGTYCVDWSCTYVTRRIFSQYCPFTLQ